MAKLYRFMIYLDHNIESIPFHLLVLHSVRLLQFSFVLLFYLQIPKNKANSPQSSALFFLFRCGFLLMDTLMIALR